MGFDNWWAKKTAYEIGLEAGIDKDMERGLEKGLEKGIIQFLPLLDDQTIAKTLGVSLNQVENLSRIYCKKD